MNISQDERDRDHHETGGGSKAIKAPPIRDETIHTPPEPPVCLIYRLSLL